MREGIDIALIYPNKLSSSETFIQAHLNGLPAKVHPLYGGWLPNYTANGPLLKTGNFFNAILAIIRRLNYYTYNDIQRPRLKKALFNYLIDNNIKAVLVEYGLTGVEVMDICHKASIPLVVHFHGFDAYVFDIITKHKEDYRALFKKASAIVAVSNDMKEQLVRLGADERKVHINSCGVDISQFKLRQNKPEKFTFLFAGRFVLKKAPDLVMAAFKKVSIEIPEARLVMMGDGGIGNGGALYNRCRQLAETMDIEDKVIFTGAYKPEELVATMPGMFCFLQHSVHPSNGDSEGTPVTLLEACSVGLPVIATKHGGIKDVVVHGETGFLIDEFDVDAMAQYMLQLIKNPDMAFNMGIAARKRIEALYAMNKSIANLWNIICQTIPDNLV